MKKVFVVLLIIMLALTMTSIPFAETQETLQWQGQGSENVQLSEGYEGWHWILTPGGGNQVVEAMLFVTMKDSFGEEHEVIANGYRPGGGERGAVHFDVNGYLSDTVIRARVEFAYESGAGQENFILTISNKIPGESVERPDPDNGDNGDNGEDPGNGDDPIR